MTLTPVGQAVAVCVNSKSRAIRPRNADLAEPTDGPQVATEVSPTPIVAGFRSVDSHGGPG